MLVLDSNMMQNFLKINLQTLKVPYWIQNNIFSNRIDHVSMEHEKGNFERTLFDSN